MRLFTGGKKALSHQRETGILPEKPASPKKHGGGLLLHHNLFYLNSWLYVNKRKLGLCVNAGNFCRLRCLSSKNSLKLGPIFLVKVECTIQGSTMTHPGGSKPPTSHFPKLGSKAWKRRKQSFPSFHDGAEAGRGGVPSGWHLKTLL